jgi:hypothetical protein
MSKRQSSGEERLDGPRLSKSSNVAEILKDSFMNLNGGGIPWRRTTARATIVQQRKESQRESSALRGWPSMDLLDVHLRR